jgi:homoserine kinase
MFPVIREISVPGSTSNLGPGFDALGLALQIALRLEVLDARDAAEDDVRWEFDGVAPPGENAIDRGYRAALAVFGPGPADRPRVALAVRVTTEIPICAGLGSSAAAFVAGLRLAEALVGAQPMDRLLALACRLEGHPDNTSASLLGGFVAACLHEDGAVTARAVRWPAHWPVVVSTPALRVETKAARAVLPPSVPFRDAIFNVQRTALLLHGVQLTDADAVRRAFGDRLHQRQRLSLVPGLEAALTWHAPGLLGVFLSGAGPSIAAVVDDTITGSTDSVRERFENLYRRLGLETTTRTLRAVQPMGTRMPGPEPA